MSCLCLCVCVYVLRASLSAVFERAKARARGHGGLAWRGRAFGLPRQVPEPSYGVTFSILAVPI